MKRSINSLNGFTIGATDGEIGTVKEFYFDDETWTIRYLVVETGSWLFGRKVLISPKALLTTDWKNKVFPVNLTMEQIKNSPPIDTEKPVSRQQELELYGYYPWGSYWGTSFYTGGTPLSASVLKASLKNDGDKITSENDTDQHLRSTDQVSGYDTKALELEIGKIEDFITNDDSWEIDFIVVQTGNWIEDRKVLISPKWIKEIKWEESEVTINASVERLKHSLKYDENTHITDTYVTKLNNHYNELL